MYKVGDVVTGTVTGSENYGLFVSLEDGYTGLIHISEISEKFVKDVKDYVSVGEKIFCQVLEVDAEAKHLKLSIKDINYKTDGSNKKEYELKMGFKPLKDNLPLWTEEKLKEYEK